MASQVASLMLQHAERLIDNGYSIIPIKPCDKAPGRWDTFAKEWRNLPSWQSFCDRQPSDAEVLRWQDWPDAGIGLPCGHIVGFDIDVMDPAKAIRLAELAVEMFGDTPLVRIGQDPKRLLVYRCDAPFASFDAKPVQVLAKGRQFVGYGIHPTTNAPYRWVFEQPDAVDRSSLPAVTEEQARAWADAATKLLGISPLQKPKPTAVSSVREPATHAAVEQALQFIPSEGISRDAWIRIGMAIKSGLGENGRDLWHGWSSLDARYTAKECDQQWNSFDPNGGIGVGTLYHEAGDHGWHPEAVFLYAHEEEAAARAIGIDVVEFCKNSWAKTRAKLGDQRAVELVSEPKWTVPSGEPGWLRDLDGGLRMFVDHVVSNAISPQPYVTLGAALAAFGTLAGRRYMSHTGLRTNLYCIGLADSGAGKGRPLKGVTELLLAADPTGSLVGGSKIASGAGLLAAATKHPTIIFPLDEVGFFFDGNSGKNGAPSHRQEISANLMELYTSTDTVFSGAAYADPEKKKIICHPHVSLFGVTTKERLWNALSSIDASDGSLARLTFFESEENFPDPNLDIIPTGMPDEIISISQAILAGAQGHSYPDMGDLSNVMSNPYRVPYANMQLHETWKEHRREQTRDARKHEGTPFTAAINRRNEVATKLALIKAVSANPGAPVIRACDLEWGFDIAGRAEEILIRGIRDNVSDNEQERNVKRVLAIIENGGSAGVPLSKITNGTPHLRGTERKDILQTLVESEGVRMLRIEPGPQGGPPKFVYFVN